ncbi:putative transferase protein [Acidobacteriia bacterium SbA2]|nr:putative transferase protein [Acidobacteriia bacterium SbA2]
MSLNAGSDRDVVDYLKSVDTPTLSNAIETLRLRPQNAGFAPLQTSCIFPEFGRMVGYAVTAQVETMSATTGDRKTFLSLYEAVMQSPKPAVVAFQEIGPQPDYAAHCGEVMATIFQRLGAMGLVSDCAVRDIPEVRALRFHYFARGAVASHAYFHIVRVGVPIQVCGLVIHPNDLLHGDENGLIVVPKEGLDKLPTAVEAVRARERALMEFVRGPEFNFDGLRQRFLE